MSQSEIMVVAGEASGDRHAAGLVRSLNRSWGADLRWYGSGGELMAAEGAELLVEVSRLAAIGPRAALSNAADYCKLFHDLLRRARRRTPRLAVLVDFPEFNLRLARRLKDMGVPVCYFVGPQLWAWRPSRIEAIRRYVDLMLVIFPFEEEFYRRRGVEAHYVGNPSVGLRRLAAAPPPDRPQARVVLMPGSRPKEVEHILPLLLSVARHVAQFCEEREMRPVRFQVVAAPTIPDSLLHSILPKDPVAGLELVRRPTADILASADFALVKSGTSTLEALLLETPFAMVYRMSTASWLFASMMVNTDTYCLANIIAGKKIVKEFVQHRASPRTIGEHVLELLRDPQRSRRLRSRLGEAALKLGSQDAYGEAAKRVARLLSQRKEAA